MGISQALWVSMRFRRFVGISRHLWGMMGLYGQELVGFTRASGGKCGGGDIKGTSGCPLMLIGLCQYQEGVEKPIWKKKKKEEAHRGWRGMSSSMGARARPGLSRLSVGWEPVVGI